MLEGDTTGQPLYDFTSEPAIQALDIMKKMLDLSSANALQPGATDGGVNQTPDEVAFSAELVPTTSNTRMRLCASRATGRTPRSSAWALCPPPRAAAGGTTFWDTGASLFKFGKNKEQAAAYMKDLTYDPTIWQNSIQGTASGHPGHMPPYQSIYDGWQANPPDWLKEQPWVPVVKAAWTVRKPSRTISSVCSSSSSASRSGRSI